MRTCRPECHVLVYSYACLLLAAACVMLCNVCMLMPGVYYESLHACKVHAW